MTTLLLAVMGQARHVRAVHSFICELLMVTMPELAKGNRYIRNSTEFCESIDLAIREVSTPDATEGDYVRFILDAACAEMAPLCNLLKAACSLAGLDKVAAEYLDGKRFREMLLRKDSAKLEKLVAIVRAREGKPIKVLMAVAAELNDKAERYDEISPAAKRKATAEMKKAVVLQVAVADAAVAIQLLHSREKMLARHAAHTTLVLSTTEQSLTHPMTEVNLLSSYAAQA